MSDQASTRDLEASAHLHIDDLTVARGGVAVLVGVSFDARPGTATLVRGPNGAGKTTLLRTLAGLQPPLAGGIRPSPESIAYASHADGLKATLTVRENLLFWAKVHGHSNIAGAIAAFDLARLEDRPAGTLSAGQKRRLGLARLCVTERPIWLLDEPTVSLDVASVDLFAGVVRSHLARGGSAVIATHIDLGLPDAQVFNVGPYRASRLDGQVTQSEHGFDHDDGDAFL